MNYQFPRPRMLQLKFELNWASGFNLNYWSCCLKVLIDNRQQSTIAYHINSPRAFGSGELKSIKSVQAYMVNISIKSQPNRAYDF